MKTFQKLMGDVKAIKGLVDKYKPVVQDKIKEYEPIIKKDAENLKNNVLNMFIGKGEELLNKGSDKLKNIKTKVNK